MRQILSRLKAIHLIPPAVALVLAGVWNASQMRSISVLEKQGESLRSEISSVRASGGADTRNSSPTTSGITKTGKRAKSDDWKSISASLATGGGTKADLRAMLDFRERVNSMSREDLITALDEIDALRLPLAEREAVEEMILAALIKQDPEYALDRFVDRIANEPHGVGGRLSTALGAWARKDRAAATAWFDRQIAAGKFETKTLDGRSEMRAQYEAALVESMVGAGLDDATARLAALPEDQRREVLQQLSFSALSPEEQKIYTEMVRGLVPGDERAGSFAHIAGELVDETGFAKVGAYLDSVNATPAERAAAAGQAADTRVAALARDGKVSQGDMDSLRQWLDKQAPGKTDAITGKALAEAAQAEKQFAFKDASALALHYQQTTGKDDVLVSFLRSYSARSNLDEARGLAAKISDPVVRARVLGGLE